MSDTICLFFLFFFFLRCANGAASETVKSASAPTVKTDRVLEIIVSNNCGGGNSEKVPNKTI